MSEFFTPSKPKVQLISLMNTQRLPEVLTTPRAFDTPARQPFTARNEYKISAFEIVRPTPSYSGLDVRSMRGLSYGGYGGLLVHEHYWKL